VKRRRLEDYELVVQFQLEARLGWMRELLARTGYSHVCMDKDPESAEWLDAATVRFGYGDTTYRFNSDTNTAGEIRGGLMWNYGPDGKVRWACRPNGMPPLVAALERGPSASPERN